MREGANLLRLACKAAFVDREQPQHKNPMDTQTRTRFTVSPHL